MAKQIWVLVQARPRLLAEALRREMMKSIHIKSYRNVYVRGWLTVGIVVRIGFARGQHCTGIFCFVEEVNIRHSPRLDGDVKPDELQIQY